MGDDVAVTAGVRVRVEDLVAAALHSTVVFVHAVHVAEIEGSDQDLTVIIQLDFKSQRGLPVGVFTTAHEFLVISTWSQLSHALVARVKAAIVSVVHLGPAVLGVGSGGRQF